MQNPFQCLKRFRPVEKNPLEDHATESLAACLVFSQNYLAKFLVFLFREEKLIPQALRDISQVQVITQHVVECGRLDLLLQAGSDFGVVVEVKVGAAQDASQLKKYEDWLQRTFGPERWKLFMLVQNRAQGFDGGNATIYTWDELHTFTQGIAARESDGSTDGLMLGAFFKYLSLERV